RNPHQAHSSIASHGELPWFVCLGLSFAVALASAQGSGRSGACDHLPARCARIPPLSGEHSVEVSDRSVALFRGSGTAVHTPVHSRTITTGAGGSLQYGIAAVLCGRGERSYQS